MKLFLPMCIRGPHNMTLISLLTFINGMKNINLWLIKKIMYLKKSPLGEVPSRRNYSRWNFTLNSTSLPNLNLDWEGEELEFEGLADLSALFLTILRWFKYVTKRVNFLADVSKNLSAGIQNLWSDLHLWSHK